MLSGSDLDKHIGDIHSAIVGEFLITRAKKMELTVRSFLDREIEITQTLLEKILTYDEAMTLTCDICAELDCLLSFAQASRIYGYHRPRIVEDNIIDIRQGRSEGCYYS